MGTDNKDHKQTSGSGGGSGGGGWKGTWRPESWRGTGGGSSHPVATSTKGCTHTPHAVQIGTVKIYAAALRTLSPNVLAHFDVISPLTESFTDAYYGYSGFNLWFPIKDFGVPEPNRLRVHCERLLTFAEKGARVLTYCVGSHGRTGLVLATCIALAEPNVDPIEAVRKRHCNHSVETSEQIRMVFTAVGRPVPARWEGQVQRRDSVVYTKPTFSPPVTSAFNATLYADVLQRLKSGVEKTPIPEATTPLNTEPAEMGRPSPVFPALPAVDSKPMHHDAKPPLVSGVRLIPPGPEDDIEELPGAVVTASGDVIVPHEQTELNLDAPPFDPADDVDQPEGDEGDADGRVASSIRPFPEDWTQEQRYRFRGVTNKRDNRGYLVCPVCHQPIYNADNGHMVKSRVGWRRVGAIVKKPRVRWAKHTRCNGVPLVEDLPYARLSNSLKDC